MSQYYGLIELVLVFGALWLFYWSQMRALRRMRAEDAAKEAAAEEAAAAGNEAAAAEKKDAAEETGEAAGVAKSPEAAPDGSERRPR